MGFREWVGRLGRWTYSPRWGGGVGGTTGQPKWAGNQVVRKTLKVILAYLGFLCDFVGEWGGGPPPPGCAWVGFREK